MKFNLEKNITSWKRGLYKYSGLEPEHIDELEDHLRSSVEESRQEGLSDAAAFDKALEQMAHMKEVSKLSKRERQHTPLLWINLKFLFKVLRKNKSHYLQSLLGLVVGIAVFILTFYFSHQELNHDSFHEKASTLYRIRNNVVLLETGEVKNARATSFLAVGAALKDQVPEVVDATTLYPESSIVVNDEEQHRVERGLYASASFFRMFSIPILQGNVKGMESPKGIFICASLAEKLFGTGNPIGKTIEYLGLRTDGEFDLEVMGVYEDIPSNSYFANTEVFLPMQILRDFHSPTMRWSPLTIEQVKWRWVDFYTFIETATNADPAVVAGKVQDVFDEHRRQYDEKAGRRQEVAMEPIDRIHLVTGVHNDLEQGTNAEIIWLFYGIGLMAMLIAWINYVNMSTATSIGRAREIGIKKVLGAFRRQLIFQFLMESLLVTVIAVVLAFALLAVLSPSLSDLFGIELVLSTGDLPFFASLIAFLLLGSLAAGFYPAVLLSAYKTLDVLKSSFTSHHGSAVRKALVIFQFTLVAFLLSGSLVVYKQFQFMITEDLGIDIDQKMAIDLPPGVLREDDFATRVVRARKELGEIPNVNAVTSCSLLPGDHNGWRHTLSVDGREQQSLITFNRMSASRDFVASMGLELIAGRDFDPRIHSDYDESLIINRVGMEELGFYDPDSIIGKVVTFAVGPEHFKVIGVVEDFHHRSLHAAIEPLSIQFDSVHQAPFLLVDFTERDLPRMMGQVEERFADIFPGHVFNYQFLDARYMEQYEKDLRFQKSFGIFTLVALLLSIVGLLALSSFFLNQQKKSVSVRKVLGAGKKELLVRLLSEYLRLTLIASALSIPLTYFAIEQWLSGFVFSINPGFWIYALPVIVLITIVLITVFQHTYRLIQVNPAKILRND